MEETIFRQELQKRTTAIEDLLKQYLPAEEGYQKTVIEAMNYSLMAGGKRLRPMLMQETYRMLGGEDDIIEPFMAAIGMIHTYSLVHDDLPAMDNDGVPSFAISLYKEYRGLGIGTMLMKRMLEELKERGYQKTSLAVQKANYAVKMYKNVGFEIIDENEEEYIMMYVFR